MNLVSWDFNSFLSWVEPAVAAVATAAATDATFNPMAQPNCAGTYFSNNISAGSEARKNYTNKPIKYAQKIMLIYLCEQAGNQLV